MALDLKASKVVTFAGSVSPAAITLTSGWTNGSGGASYTPATNDVVYVAYAVGTANADIDVALSTAGYTELADIVAGASTSRSNLGVFRKVMGGTPDTTMQPASTGSAQWAGAVVIEVWSGVDTTTPEDVTTTTATGTATGRPDPPSITPTTSGAIVTVFGAGAAATCLPFSQSGSELSDFISGSQADTQDVAIGGGQFAWTSGAFNPVAWVGGTTGANDSWTAACVAIRPASAPAATPRSFGFIF